MTKAAERKAVFSSSFLRCFRVLVAYLFSLFFFFEGGFTCYCFVYVVFTAVSDGVVILVPKITKLGWTRLRIRTITKPQGRRTNYMIVILIFLCYIYCLLVVALLLPLVVLLS